jgi:mannose-6-phosphate isomerase-like protein (cupin superfamily)
MLTVAEVGHTVWFIAQPCSAKGENAMTFINLSLDQPVARKADTKTGALIAMGARFVMDGKDSAGRVGLIEHPIIPRGLASPMHLHTREDEYSYILKGRWGFQLGDDIVYGEPGDLVYKPRDVWHSFWNASDGPGRLLEIISPSGFEHYFVELSELLQEHGMERMDLFEALNEKYGLGMDFSSIEGLVQAHGLVPSAPPAA